MAFFLLTFTTLCGGCASILDRSARESSSDTPPISYSDLPDEIGRGYPVVLTDDDNSSRVDITPGAAAPDFSLVLDDGQSLRLADLRGRPVMLNFWATWCPPCRAEMPDIVTAAGEDDELVVIAANVQESMGTIRPFAEEYGMEMPVTRDVDRVLFDLYQVRGMPTSVFIDRDGTIASIWAGALTYDELQRQLDGIR